MDRNLVAILGLILVLTLVGPVFSEQALTVYYFPRPPLYIVNSDGSAGGFLSEIVKLVFNDAGIKYEFKNVPTKRILENLRQKEYSCGIGWFKNPEREQFALFSESIYRDLPMAAVIHKDKVAGLPANPTMEQLLTSKLTLGLKEGFSYGPWAEEAIQKFKPTTVTTTTEQVNLLLMITNGRADYTFMSVEEATWLLQSDQTLGAGLKVVKVQDAPEGNSRYIMFSQGVDKAVVDKVNQSIAKVVKSEAYRKLIDLSGPAGK